MSKSRTITGFGTADFRLTSAESTGPWIRFGPFFGPNLTAFSSFVDAATSQAATLQVALTTESTGSWSDLIQFGNLTTDAAPSTTKFGPKNSTLAGSSHVFNFIRLGTTSLASTGTMQVTCWFVSVDGGR